MSEPLKNLFNQSKTDRVLLWISGICLVGLLYLLFFYVPEMARHEEPVVGVIKTTGTVRRRISRSLHWRDVKGDVPLHLKDIVYTPKEARATIVFTNGKTMEMEPDSMVQFDEINTNTIEITLFNLGFNLLPVPKDARSGYLPDIRPLELRQSELSARLSDHLKKDLGLQEVKKIKFQLNPLDKLGYFTLHLVKPLGERFNLHSNRWLPMVWTPVPVKGTEFKLEVSKDRNFRRLLPHTTHVNGLAVQFDHPAQYFWRVKATKGEENLFSPIGEFGMSMHGGKTSALSLRLPSSQPTGFTVEIATDEGFSSIVKSTVNVESKCPQQGLSAGTYFCRVRSIQENTIVNKYQFEVK